MQQIIKDKIRPEKEEIKFYINDKINQIKNDIWVEIISRNMQVEYLQDDTFDI